MQLDSNEVDKMRSEIFDKEKKITPFQPST